MTRAELLKSPDYWIAYIQVALYNCAEKFMSDYEMNRTQLAEHLGVSKGYVSQLLNGDYDHKISKLVELSLKFGYVPKIEFEGLQEYIRKDSDSQLHSWGEREYLSNTLKKKVTIDMKVAFTQNPNVEYEKAA